jgi:hypothetical protein
MVTGTRILRLASAIVTTTAKITSAAEARTPRSYGVPNRRDEMSAIAMIIIASFS